MKQAILGPGAIWRELLQDVQPAERVGVRRRAPGRGGCWGGRQSPGRAGLSADRYGARGWSTQTVTDPEGAEEMTVAGWWFVAVLQ